MFDMAYLSELLAPIVRVALSDLEDFTIDADAANAIRLAAWLEAVTQAFAFVVGPTALGAARAERTQVETIALYAHARRTCVGSAIGKHCCAANEQEHGGNTADDPEPL
jgi:hypothetical protein